MNSNRQVFLTAFLTAILACAGEVMAGIPAGVPDAGRLHRPFDDEDAGQFLNPPAEFHPETWYHFIGGNVAKPGITADLEAISKAGIQGIQLFHGQFGGPWPGVEPQIKCLTPAWDDMVNHAATECNRLGLRFTMQNCPGWAMAGGPWITPDKAMRHLVWSRTDLQGGANRHADLPLPQPSGEDWRDYKDVCVVAFPTPEGDAVHPLTPQSVKSNRPDLPWDKCLAGDPAGRIMLDPGEEPAWVEVTFDKEVTLRTVELPPVQEFNHGWCYLPGVTVTMEALLPDGLHEVARHVLPESNFQDHTPISLACSEATSRTYRITIDNKHPLSLAWLHLFTGARKNNWESEAAFTLRGLDRAPHPRQSKSAWIDPGRIVDLTDRMDPHGGLNWTAPPGGWTVLRFGHVNTGKQNGPAPPEATGWECDKLSPAGADAHFAGYVGRIASNKGPAAGGLLKGMLTDSWECETQTWTPGMDREFARRRGYPLRKWFPALAGYVAGDPETTGRFLRDWRVTVNDLLVENFFGRMAKLAHDQKLTVSYETASGDVFPGDIMEYYKHADVPMCEFWQPRMENFVGSFDFKPVKPCVSAARLYGKPRVAAEAFTSFNLTWNEHPAMLKPIADLHLAEGVTHLVFHTFTHNPRTDWLPPGTAFGSSIGTPFLRGQTWWPHMKEFTDYLARCEFMLERGRPVSDVLWYLGDEQDHKPPQEAPFPAGFRYDYCNPDVLLHRLSVRDGRIVTPEGLEYRVLWLPDCPRMTPETLERMVAMVKQGAVIVGDRPRGLATLSGGADAEKRFKDAVTTLWGGEPRNAGTRRIGRGAVIAGRPLEAALLDLRLTPDVQGPGVVWTHRRSEGADWYFVAAPNRRGFSGTLRFRASGKVGLWNPLTGEIRPPSATRRVGDTSLVTLDLPPSGSVFVMFRDEADNRVSPIVRLTHNQGVVADVTAEDPGSIMPRVISARYGDPADPARGKDVTGLVREELARGRDSVTGGNEWAGGDPAPRTVKVLSVVLRLADGRETSLQEPEGRPLALAEPFPSSPPACETIDEGRRIIAWESGTYQITRADGHSVTREAHPPAAVSLTGPWTLRFPKGWGAPESLTIDKLAPWPELDLGPAGKAFSGTATYTHEFSLPALEGDDRVLLDLGDVEVIAAVRLNGKPVATLWTAPYRVDLTHFAKPGVNQLDVEVTNTWFNRLVYDAGQEENARKTWTISGPSKDRALEPAGLLGPVVLHMGKVLE